MTLLKSLSVFTLAMVLGCGPSAEKQGDANFISTFSPDKHNEIRVYTQGPLAYEVLRDGECVVSRTEIGLKLNGKCVTDGAQMVGGDCDHTRVVGVSEASPVYKKSKVSLDCRGSLFYFGDFILRVIARNDGVAYRFELLEGATVDCEKAPVTVPASAKCWFNRTNKIGCEETVPEFASVEDIKIEPKNFIHLPFAYEVNGKTVAVTDADVRDYAIWNFGSVTNVDEGVRFESVFARYPKAVERVGGWGNAHNLPSGGRWVMTVEEESFIVKCDEARTLPWRAFMLADAEPSKLVESDLVWALSLPADVNIDYSWVKPGKVAWDWWNCFDNAPKSAPNGGCTTKTYERFIDFAAKSGVEYVIFDEGWSESLNIWEFHPEVDVPHLIEYAEKKGVGIILWMAWAQVYGEEAKVAEHFSKLGAKGFKVDFMDRGDAQVCRFLEDFARECAKNHMLLDYHGAYRPTGMQRTYPNILNYEGIHGLEQMKWAPADKDMPYNDVACCYLRMLAGPMDYTPGAMLNYPLGKYTAGEEYRFPGSVGTRCHQMAMMSVYEAPLQMLCDSPTNYEKNMACFTVMAETPTVWADTVALGGTPSTYIALARRSREGVWYVAGLGNSHEYDVEFDTAFLGEGEWTAEIFRDAEDSDVEPTHYIHETKTVVSGDSLEFHLAPGGGFTVRFVK